jgi:hypothetical protein
MAMFSAKQSPTICHLCPGPFIIMVDTARDCMRYLEDSFKDDSNKHLPAIVDCCKTIVGRWNFVRSFIYGLDCARSWEWDSPEEVNMRELAAAVDYIDLFVRHRFFNQRFQIEHLHCLHSCLGLIDRLIGDVI